MSLLIPPGFGQLNIVFTWIGDPEPMLTSIGLELDDVPGGSDVFDLYANAGWTDLLQAASTPTVQVNSLNMQVGQDGAPPIVVDAVPQPADAGNTGDTPLPQNCTLLLKKRTALGGRQGRGRMYWPGPDEDSVSDIGVLDNTYRGNVQTKLEDIISLGAGLTSPFVGYVLLHSDATVPTPITSFLCDTRIATQRRRLRP